jgi:hypothetical protein
VRVLDHQLSSAGGLVTGWDLRHYRSSIWLLLVAVVAETPQTTVAAAVLVDTETQSVAN